MTPTMTPQPHTCHLHSTREVALSPQALRRLPEASRGVAAAAAEDRCPQCEVPGESELESWVFEQDSALFTVSALVGGVGAFLIFMSFPLGSLLLGLLGGALCLGGFAVTGGVVLSSNRTEERARLQDQLRREALTTLEGEEHLPVTELMERVQEVPGAWEVVAPLLREAQLLASKLEEFKGVLTPQEVAKVQGRRREVYLELLALHSELGKRLGAAKREELFQGRAGDASGDSLQPLLRALSAPELPSYPQGALAPGTFENYKLGKGLELAQEAATH